ncbi:hypothetical protein C8Q75DRAFT_808603 [Abortiporus biennis]|nr:hypothetical protein C8Q75DRAFT_808603 [Abortiporus biennis]
MSTSSRSASSDEDKTDAHVLNFPRLPHLLTTQPQPGLGHQLPPVFTPPQTATSSDSTCTPIAQSVHLCMKDAEAIIGIVFFMWYVIWGIPMTIKACRWIHNQFTRVKARFGSSTRSGSATVSSTPVAMEDLDPEKGVVVCDDRIRPISGLPGDSQHHRLRALMALTRKPKTGMDIDTFPSRKPESSHSPLDDDDGDCDDSQLLRFTQIGFAPVRTSTTKHVRSKENQSTRRTTGFKEFLLKCKPPKPTGRKDNISSFRNQASAAFGHSSTAENVAHSNPTPRTKSIPYHKTIHDQVEYTRVQSRLSNFRFPSPELSLPSDFGTSIKENQNPFTVGDDDSGNMEYYGYDLSSGFGYELPPGLSLYDGDGDTLVGPQFSNRYKGKGKCSEDDEKSSELVGKTY